MATTEQRRISQLDEMEDSTLNGIVTIDTATKDSEYKSTNWFMGVDYHDESDLTQDFGTKRIPLSRVALLNESRLIPAFMLPSHIDEAIFGNMEYDDETHHYCFTTTEAEGVTIKYGCPEQLEGEIAPRADAIYVDNDPETSPTIQYRYSASANKFAIIPQSVLLTNGNGTVVRQTGAVADNTYEQHIDINIGSPFTPSETETTDALKVLMLKDNTLCHVKSGVTANSYGTASDQSELDFGGTFKIPYFTVNDTGHISSASDVIITIPSTHASDTVYGIVTLDSTTNSEVVQVGTSNSAGTSTNVARADHVHKTSGLILGTASNFKYSPSSETDATITSTHLLTALNITDISNQTAVDVSNVDSSNKWTTASTNAQKLLKAKKSETTMSLESSVIGSSESDNANVVSFGTKSRSSLLLSTSANKHTVLASNSSGDDIRAALLSVDKSTYANVSVVAMNYLKDSSNKYTAELVVGSDSADACIVKLQNKSSNGSLLTTSLKVDSSVGVSMDYTLADVPSASVTEVLTSARTGSATKLTWNSMSDILPFKHCIATGGSTSQQHSTIEANKSLGLAYQTVVSKSSDVAISGYSTYGPSKITITGLDESKPTLVMVSGKITMSGVALDVKHPVRVDALFGSTAYTIGKVLVDFSETEAYFNCSALVKHTSDTTSMVLDVLADEAVELPSGKTLSITVTLTNLSVYSLN